MLGLILLFISIFCYCKPVYRAYSLVLYIGFMLGTLNGYGLFIDDITGVKNVDLALMYTLVIASFNKWKINRSLKRNNIFKVVMCFVVFLVASLLFSWQYYNIPLIDAFRGVRSYFLILSLFVMQYFSLADIKKALRVIFYISIITSVLFILQIPAKRPLLPYPWEYSFDEATGLIRLYNSPELLYFFLFLSFTTNDIIPRKRAVVARCVLILCLLCTLGRTQILVGLLGLLLLLLLNGKVGKIAQFIVLILLISLPFYDIILQRFEGGGTTDDIARIQSKDYEDYHGGDGTMIYRLAWVTERYDYMENRPVAEQLMGLGMILEGDPLVYKMYNFRTGLRDAKGNVMQLSTPDIAFGDLMVRLGFLGSFIYLSLYLCLMTYFYKKREQNHIYKVALCVMATYILLSFSGSIMAQPKNLSIYFLILILSLYEYNSKNNSCNSNL